MKCQSYFHDILPCLSVELATPNEEEAIELLSLPLPTAAFLPGHPLPVDSPQPLLVAHNKLSSVESA